MIVLCREVGLPEPDFEQRAGQFVVTLWRDWLTGEVMATLGLNERQKKSVSYVRQEGRISNTIYQTLTGVAKRTAHRDLTELVEKGVFRRVGKTGKGTFYEFMKGATKGPKGP